ncbi:hypothetical protein GCM10022221_64360 [Actinocorallia aurea]
MPAAEISLDRDPLGAGGEFAVAVRTTRSGGGPVRRTHRASYAIVLDASQSMSWEAEPSGGISRWALALQAVEELLRLLPDGDELHVVAFNNVARAIVRDTTVAELRASGRVAREPAPEYGTTNIEAGLSLAYDLLGRSTAPARRAILLSDGEPNDGATSPQVLAALAGRAADRDIYTDTIGMGAGADIDLLMGISARGSNGHVPSAEGARRVIAETVGRLARQGQNLAASGGEVNLEIHPLFPVEAVYELTPVRRRLETGTGSGPDGAQTVRIPLGAVGTGDQEPVYALRLRAPNKIVNKSLEIVKASGSLRTEAGVVALAPSTAAIRGIAEKPEIQLDRVMVQIKSIDLEAVIARRLKENAPGAHPDIYRAAIERALSEGLDELAETYQLALRGLESGLDANDVRNEQRSRSSTNAGGANETLRKRPILDPRIGPARAEGPRVIDRTRSDHPTSGTEERTEGW